MVAGDQTVMSFRTHGSMNHAPIGNDFAFFLVMHTVMTVA